MSEQPKVAPTRLVYSAIRRVMEDMAKSGVGKLKTNTQQNFTYRGVDDVMDALAPSLAKHGLIIVPHVHERVMTERQSRAGGTLFHTLLLIDYDFICVDDGSVQHVGPIYGEAMDSGDKATNKAMATAYKYCCVQTFCIPITGGDDPDAHTHELAAKNDAPAPARQEVATSTGGAKPPRSAPERPIESGGKPDVMRPSGIFGYGKKNYDVPWNVMTTRDLEWFLSAERTPQATREKIVAELAWRDYETAQLELQIAREKENQLPLGEDIP